MIPSRPLRFSDIFSETFAIATRTFPRYALFYLVCLMPAFWMMSEGIISGVSTSLQVAQRQYGFTDEDLTAARNILRDSLARDNPAFRQQLDMLREDRAVQADSGKSSRYSSDSARLDSLFLSINSKPRVHLTTVISEHFDEIARAAGFFFFGGLVYLIGIVVLLAAVTELGVQVFEERRQRLGYTLRRVFAHHLGSVLGIAVLYGVASFALWILSISVGAIRYGGFFITAGIFVFWCFGSLGLSLSVPAAVSENLGPIAAFRRSWQLMYRGKWRLFGSTLALMLILVPIVLFLSLVTSMIFMGASVSFWEHALYDPNLTINWLLNAFAQLMRSSTLANSVTGLIVTPLWITFFVVYYYDRRTRIDGPLTYDEPTAPDQPLAMWQP